MTADYLASPRRTDADTIKVEADGFDSIYVAVSRDDHGHAIGLKIDAPGKYRDQALGVLFDAISEKATELLACAEPSPQVGESERAGE